MYRLLSNLVPKDPDLPHRAWQLTVFDEFLSSAIYDRLQYEFFEERDGSGEYIPIAKRAPSVVYELNQIVVNDSVSFLFAEGRWPTINCGDDEAAEDTIRAIIKECQINTLLVEAATRGSIGSACIWVRVLDSRLFFKALPTIFLTPEFEPNAPDTLKRVTEKYKVKGRTLKSQGYAIAADDESSDFWFQRVWDEISETWFIPWKVKDNKAGPVIDTANTVNHGLGFVPMIWVKNLPGGDDIDGACTFKASIKNSIEINYQLSQAGRGLKYSSSPTLMIKDSGVDTTKRQHIVGDALIVPSEGDAKLLEISGEAASAVIAYANELRKMALESVGGSRADSDKLSAATSGRAMELMNQALINLADKLRSSYGEGGLFRLLKMIAAISRKMQLVDANRKPIEPIPENVKITLVWPAWFAPTADDRQADALAITTLKSGGVLSTETAVGSIASEYDIEDVQAELARIKSDVADDLANHIALNPPEKIPAPKPAK